MVLNAEDAATEVCPNLVYFSSQPEAVGALSRVLSSVPILQITFVGEACAGADALLAAAGAVAVGACGVAFAGVDSLTGLLEQADTTRTAKTLVRKCMHPS